MEIKKLMKLIQNNFNTHINNIIFFNIVRDFRYNKKNAKVYTVR